MGRKQIDIQPDTERHPVAGDDTASHTGNAGSLATAIGHHRARRLGNALRRQGKPDAALAVDRR